MNNFCRIRVVDFDAAAATQFQHLRKQRLRVGTMDLKIAAIVLASNATLLTRNFVDFRKVSGLQFDDWTR
jgi:tRNA(fMet)-specific endonuclease VapC